MGSRFNGPHRIKLLVRQLQIQGIHDGEATGEPFRCQFGCTTDLGRTDADSQNIEAIVTGQDPRATPNATANIQDAAAGWQLVQTAPAHQFVHEGLLGLTKIGGSCRFPVIAEVNVLTPEPFQQSVIRPGVIGRRNTVR